MRGSPRSSKHTSATCATSWTRWARRSSTPSAGWVTACGHPAVPSTRPVSRRPARRRGTRRRGNIKDGPFVVPGTSPRLRTVARPVPRSGLSAQVGFRRRLAEVLVVASPVDVVAGQVRGIVVTELITGGALILLLALGGRWLIGRGLAPLSEMAGTAQRITTQGDLTTRKPGAHGSTAVGRLGAAINTMLDRIQQAFGARLHSEAKVRQFAADASHELRTPLTTIRGYAELYRQGALDDDQLPDAMRRIEQEARRMSTLVAELLELARLDRISSLDITETDLAVPVPGAGAACTDGRP